MTRNLQPRAAPAHTAWINRIRELRLAGCTLDEARAIAGPMPGREPDLDELASAIAYGVLLAAFAEYGFTRRAVRAAQLAVIGSSAFENEGSPDARTVRDG